MFRKFISGIPHIDNTLDYFDNPLVKNFKPWLDAGEYDSIIKIHEDNFKSTNQLLSKITDAKIYVMEKSPTKSNYICLDVRNLNHLNAFHALITNAICSKSFPKSFIIGDDQFKIKIAAHLNHKDILTYYRSIKYEESLVNISPVKPKLKLKTTSLADLPLLVFQPQETF